MVVTLEQLRMIPLLYTSIGFVMTVFRLYARRKSFGWDDTFAVLCFLANLGQTVSLSIVYFGPPIFEPTYQKLVISYLNVLLFYCVDWFARIAILFSIIRITTDKRDARILRILAVVFGVLLCGNMALWVGVCQRDTTWQQNPLFPVCIPGKAIPAYQITVGVLADSILIFVPLRTLRKLTSNPPMRRRLMVLFSASLLLTIAWIVQAIIIYTTQDLVTLIWGLTEGVIAMIVCNLPVVVIAFMHIIGMDTSRSTLVASKPTPATSLKFNSPKATREKFNSKAILSDSVFSETIVTTHNGDPNAMSLDDLPKSTGTYPSSNGYTSTAFTESRKAPSLNDGDADTGTGIAVSQGQHTTTFVGRLRNLDVDSDIEYRPTRGDV